MSREYLLKSKQLLSSKKNYIAACQKRNSHTFCVNHATAIFQPEIRKLDKEEQERVKRELARLKLEQERMKQEEEHEKKLARQMQAQKAKAPPPKPSQPVVQHVTVDKTASQIVDSVRKTLESQYRHDDKTIQHTQNQVDITLKHMAEMEKQIREDNLRRENAMRTQMMRMEQRDHLTFEHLHGQIDKLILDQNHEKYDYGHHTNICADIEHMLTLHPRQCDTIRTMYNDANCCGLSPPPVPPELVGIEVSVIVTSTLVMLAFIFFIVYYSIRFCACCACCKCCACCYCDRRRKRRDFTK